MTTNRPEPRFPVQRPGMPSKATYVDDQGRKLASVRILARKLVYGIVITGKTMTEPGPIWVYQTDVTGPKWIPEAFFRPRLGPVESQEQRLQPADATFEDLMKEITQ